VSEFLVEAYVPRAAAVADAPGVEQASLAAEELTREGHPVRLVRSIFVPGEETCFYLYQALSVDAVREAASRAGLRFERVSEAVSDETAQTALAVACPTTIKEEAS
jgi:hypothetical protein